MAEHHVAIIQSNYIPWKGYFDIVAAVDRFVLLDDVQYTKNDWRNRNQIKTSQGLQWLTLPVERGSLSDRIRDKRVQGDRWVREHLRSIEQAYAKSPRAEDHLDAIRSLYDRWAGEPHASLSEVNAWFITGICRLLGITTQIEASSQYDLPEGKNERLLSLLQQTGATHYLSGPAASAYLDESSFARAGVSVEFFDYSGYEEYRQLHGDFVHGVSVVDLLLNAGTDARSYLKTP